ncbi:MAG: DedA family protein [Candidatus Omnitrophota bacterium]
MNIFHQIETALVSFAHRVPVEWFTFIGSFVEEVVAPIPSPLIMTMAGSLAFSQNHALPFLLWLSLVGAIGKTLGAWIIYWIAAKLGHVIIGRFGGFLGVSPADVEGVGRHFRGGWRDYFIMFVLRAVPIMPTSPVSVVCGVIRVDFKAYMVGSFFGNFVRNLVYSYIGYAGVAAYESVVKGLTGAESVLQLVMLVLLVAVVVWAYWRRRKGFAK